MISVIFAGIASVMMDVFIALAPLVVVFAVFQIFFLRLPKSITRKVIRGFILAFIGLVLFLQGVNVGFMPTGEYIGKGIGALANNWILVPIGFILGFATIFAEPAVKVLNTQVEKATGGSINQKIMLYTLSIGVAVSVALAMLRILLGIPLWYFLVPGYITAFILTKFVRKTFVGIAFDSGAVATGPITVTFILALAVGGASVVQGRDPLIDGFGMVSLVALAPILSVLILGFVYTRKERHLDE